LYDVGKMYLFFYSHEPKSYSDTKWNRKTKPWVYSNWFQIPYTNNDQEYACVEQEFMHQKALLFGDNEIAEKIMSTSSPQLMKKLGRRVHNFSQSEWDKHKYEIVKSACLAKFYQNPALAKSLMATGNCTIVEASPFDTIWGIGFSRSTALNTQKYWGQNLLGKILMEIREILRNDSTEV